MTSWSRGRCRCWIATLALCLGLLSGCGAAVSAAPGARLATEGRASLPPPARSPAPPTPIPTPLLGTTGPFALVFTYGPCAPLYRLDTAAGIYTRLQVGDTPPASVPLHLTATELARIRARMAGIDFFAYPGLFTGRPATGSWSGQEPAPVYDLTVRDGGRVKEVHWDETVTRPILPAAARLRALAALIERAIAAHPEAAQLPPAFMGCA